MPVTVPAQGGVGQGIAGDLSGLIFYSWVSNWGSPMSEEGVALSGEPATESSARRSKGDRTRASILMAAERFFAERGFADTRLEDVAAEVGVRRAALFYHFRDKQALYDAVVYDVFDDLLTRLAGVLGSSGSVTQQIDTCIEVWVDAVGARPSLARFMLREAAGADPGVAQPLVGFGARLLSSGQDLLKRGVSTGVLRPIHSDPSHVISAVVGSTVFYVAALRRLLPTMGFDPLRVEELEAHKKDVLSMVHLLLGYRPESLRTGDPS